MRTALVIITSTFIALLGAGTIFVAMRAGADVFTFAAIAVLALFSFGILGALRERRRG